MRKLAVLALALTALNSNSSFAPGQARYPNYLWDYVGTKMLRIERGNGSVFKLSAVEDEGFNGSLQKLADLLLSQPTISPPHGVNVFGFLRVLVPHFRDMYLRAPVPGHGYAYFGSYADQGNGPAALGWGETATEIKVFVNDPESANPNIFIMDKHKNRKICYAMEQYDQLQGFPLYRGGDTAGDTIVLSGTGRPPWIPLTREEYVKIQIYNMETEQTPPKKMIADHKSYLESMTPAERKEPARKVKWWKSPVPDLAPAGSKEGRLLVVTNPEWFDPSLPRTAIQMIVMSFGVYSDRVLKAREDHRYHAAPHRLAEMLRTTDWKAISSLVVGLGKSQ